MTDINLKTATEDTSLDTDAFLFGADSQSASSPSVYKVSTLKTLLLGGGSLAITASKTLTASNSLTLAGTDSTTHTFPSTSATIARTDAGQTFTGDQTISSGSLSLSGNISSAAWTTNGIRYKNVAATLTDTTSTGTVAAAYTNVFGGNTIAASNATTFTDYFTTYISEPTAGTNVTLTNKWAAGFGGNVKVTGALTLGTALSAANGGTGLTALGTGVATALGNATNGSGGLLTQLTVNSTATSGGAAGQIMYDDGSKLQESVNLTFSTSTLTIGVAGTTTGTLKIGNSASAAAAFLTTDANNIFAQVNSTNAQTFRVYASSASSNANFQRLTLSAGVTSNMAVVAADNGGTGVAMGLQFGVAKTTGGGVTSVARFTTSSLFVLGDSVAETTSFPALKRSSATLQVRLADDSALTNIEALNLTNGRTIQKFTPLDNQPPASNFATLDTRNSIAVLDFDDTTAESAVFVGVVSAGAILSGGISVRIHWMATTATSGNCRWSAAFEYMNTDLDTDSFDTATAANSAANGTCGIPSTLTLTCTTIDSLVAGAFFRVKITREAADGGDTMTGDAELIAVELQQVA